jgi:hypothetical protein
MLEITTDFLTVLSCTGREIASCSGPLTLSKLPPMDGHQYTATSSTSRVARDERIRLPRVRSKITNHADLLPGLDGRSPAARRYRDLILAFLSDAGGLDCVSEIRLGLLRRLAAATVQAELLEARMINGEAINIGLLCTLASTSVRLSSRLGLDRVSRDVTPTLAEYLAATEAGDAA